MSAVISKNLVEKQITILKTSRMHRNDEHAILEPRIFSNRLVKRRNTGDNDIRTDNQLPHAVDEIKF